MNIIVFNIYLYVNSIFLLIFVSCLMKLIQILKHWKCVPWNGSTIYSLLSHWLSSKTKFCKMVRSYKLKNYSNLTYPLKSYFFTYCRLKKQMKINTQRWCVSRDTLFVRHFILCPSETPWHTWFFSIFTTFPSQEYFTWQEIKQIQTFGKALHPILNENPLIYKPNHLNHVLPPLSVWNYKVQNGGSWNCATVWDTTHISPYLIGYKKGIPVNVTHIYRAFLGDALGLKFPFYRSDIAENSKILKWASATFYLGHHHLKKISKIQQWELIGLNMNKLFVFIDTSIL